MTPSGGEHHGTTPTDIFLSFPMLQEITCMKQQNRKKQRCKIKNSHVGQAVEEPSYD